MLIILLLLLCVFPAIAEDLLQTGEPQFDRPTLMALGIKLPIAGDDNGNASVRVFYRLAGAEDWNEALPLFRMRPETVVGWKVEPQFSGSIFDLLPATAYEVALRIVDPDGVGETRFLTASTRAVPADPPAPNERRVGDADALRAALRDAQPGDVIVLDDGVYMGSFSMSRAGAPGNPIVIRGTSDAGAILDGGDCTGCNVLEVYGAGFVHIERLTIRNAVRAIRFQTQGAEGNVVRRVRTENTRLGIGSQADQKDFYICDNVLEGRLRWPATYPDDRGARANDDGIRVQGFGHVVCHNRISGFGDAMKVEQNGVFAFHNTFVSPGVPLTLQTTAATHHFVVSNNLFVGPESRAGGRIVDWTGPVRNGVFDYNRYFPDGVFAFNLPDQGGIRRFESFVALQNGGLEEHGTLLTQAVFANGLQPPESYREQLEPQDVVLHPESNALDRGLILLNVNDRYTGAGPDLGAEEFGCAAPIYGPRPEGVDESNQPVGCQRATSADRPSDLSPRTRDISPSRAGLP